MVRGSYLALPGHPPEPGYEAELRDVAGRVEHGIVFGAFVHQVPVGCVSFVPAAGSFHSENLLPGESSFRMLGVDPAWQGRGVGEALVRQCLSEARSFGSTGVFIYTGDWMATAQRLYARLGFERIPERDWRFEDPPMTLLALRYSL